MNTVLWIVQGILAMMFLMAGMMKIKQAKEEMAEKMPWVEDFSQGQIRSIGIVEVMGALGLILPMVTGIMPILTPLAAVGLALTMVGAFMTHLRRKEMVPMGAMNMMLFAMAAFVAYGRF
ncbi:MAG: DoxX family protein [Anaerolineae bacterium]|jgi:VIT1/CCC1 family predicted Fe2+/Mn2+ transporter|nr:DoxX family protein [Anaerolineae bacterium]MBT4311728.1 DoxX family protein [Anaerolineae bacterium]MBT4458540.1 DoxX family protein [Anaerolineae bacterium]MBT4842716.1 DoxX family protein [Anaerolineae bacterium]MBT6063131.1 DoxX family protein [Anaerolineae bacterium]